MAPSDHAVPCPPQAWRWGAKVGLGLLLLVVLVLISLGSEPGRIDVLAWAIRPESWPQPDVWKTVLLDLRLPRALLAAIVGAALAAAGAVTQGLFRNPLADPSVLGVSSGAALAAVAGFSVGLDQTALWATPLLAGIGAAATLIVLLVLLDARTDLVRLLLGGVAVGTFASAVITLLLVVRVERWEVGLRIVNWLMGSFEGRSWEHLTWGLAPFAVGGGLAFYVARDLDVLHLGEDTARTLGVDHRRTYALAIAGVALLVGTATALVGMIAFVGLVVPHLGRRLAGAKHWPVLTASMILGAAFLLVVDIVTRAAATIQIPPGVITSLLGAPLFLTILRSQR